MTAQYKKEAEMRICQQMVWGSCDSSDTEKPIYVKDTYIHTTIHYKINNL